MIERVISGGQTGVDRAALDVALKLGVPCGGWCPRGRRAEDGPLKEIYPLQETPSSDYTQRTRWNVRDSDGTVVLYKSSLSGGSALTVELAKKHNKPCLVIDLCEDSSPEILRDWLKRQQIRTLNVAGPRESGRTGIYDEASQFLDMSLSLTLSH
jgi:hypothetical protein